MGRASCVACAACAVLAGTAFCEESSPIDRTEEERIALAALDKRVDIDCDHRLLSDALADICEPVGLKVAIAPSVRAKKWGQLLEPFVYLEVRGVRLRTALEHLVRGNDLAWGLHGDRVLVVPASDVDDVMRTHACDVGDLATASRSSQDALLDAVRLCAPVESWADDGGHGRLQIESVGDRRMLVARQTVTVHLEIESLFRSLRVIQAGRRLDHGDLDRRVDDWRERLDQNITAKFAAWPPPKFQSRPDDPVLQFLARKLGRPLLVFQSTTYGQSATRSFSLYSDNTRLRDALDEVGDQMSPLREIVVDDDMLWFTDYELAKEKRLGLRVHDLTDLPDIEDSDLELAILAALYSSDWRTMDGPGGLAILRIERGLVLIARCEPDTHREIDLFLQELTAAATAPPPDGAPAFDRERLLSNYHGEPIAPDADFDAWQEALDAA